MSVITPLAESCRNISYDSENYELVAECRRKDGSWRWSRLYLNYCVDVTREGSLRASVACPNEYLMLEPRDNEEPHIRNVRLQSRNEGGKTLHFLKAECVEIKRGWFSETREWKPEQELCLDTWTSNVDGYLVFYHPKDEAFHFPEWASIAIDIADKFANAPDDINEAYDQAQEDFLSSIGGARLEFQEKKWFEGTVPTKDDRFLRRGT
ncbi:hypothetical protein BT69DRAFT_1349267 [Atractiella rhizophila]|nr:hypothetical protein BT69DRAFT_1349267 [Atractiella rhizophila]